MTTAQAAPPLLEYRPPGRSPLSWRRLFRWLLIYFYLTLVPLTATVFGLITLVPKFHEIFKDFRINASGIPRAIFNLCDDVSSYSGLFSLATILLIWSLLPATLAARQETSARRLYAAIRYTAGLLLLTLIFWIVSLLALCVPVIKAY